MTAHRVQPQMMGITPSNVGGFDDVEKASLVFFRNDQMAQLKHLQELNEWLSIEVIQFPSYKL